MRLSDILTEGSLKLRLDQLRMDRRSVKAVLHDLAARRFSRSPGPVEVIGTEYNQYQLGDGYHRVLQAILRGETIIRGRRASTSRYAVTPPAEVWIFNPASPTFGLETVVKPEDIARLVAIVGEAR